MSIGSAVGYPPQGHNVFSYLTGSLLQVTNAIATNITGSTLISGSDIRGPIAEITNVSVANISGSGNISGSTLLVGSGGILNAPFIDIYGSDFGCILYLPFEEGTGSVVYDQSPYGNDGTIAGSTWTSGKFGEALLFDGINDFVQMSDTSILRLNGAFTITLWAKILSVSGTGYDGWIIKRSSGGPNSGYYIYYAIPTGLMPSPRFGMNAVEHTWSTSTILALDIWDMWTVTYDGSSALTFYKNGVQTKQETGITFNTNTDPQALRAGQSDDFGNSIIDEIRIYNRALSIDEIRIHYLNTMGMYSRSVVVSDKFRILGSTLSPNFSAINGQASGSTGSFGRLQISTTNNALAGLTGSMLVGEVILFTGSGTGLMYTKLPSGSTNAIFSFTGAYVGGTP